MVDDDAIAVPGADHSGDALVLGPAEDEAFEVRGVIAADDPKNPLGEHWIGLTGTEGAAVDTVMRQMTLLESSGIAETTSLMVAPGAGVVTELLSNLATA